MHKLRTLQLGLNPKTFSRKCTQSTGKWEVKCCFLLKRYFQFGLLTTIKNSFLICTVWQKHSGSWPRLSRSVWRKGWDSVEHTHIKTPLTFRPLVMSISSKVESSLLKSCKCTCQVFLSFCGFTWCSAALGVRMEKERLVASQNSKLIALNCTFRSS